MRMAVAWPTMFNAAIALVLHDRQHRFYHGEKTEHLVAQLTFENIERRIFDGAAQMRAGVIDQNVDAPEGFERAIDENLRGAWVGDVGDDAERAALGGQFSYRRVKLRCTATANCNRAPFV